MTQPVCTIVGIGPGIGLAVARRFAREGYVVAMVARKVEPLQRYQADLGAEGIEAHSFPADAADADSLTAAFSRIHQQLGTTQVLVYNAAVLVSAKPTELDAEKLVGEFRVNVVGALVAAQQVIGPMKAQKKGTILFTGGGLALQPFPPYASLAIGKAGIRSLAYTLGGELEVTGIHVATVTICGSVEPGTKYDPDVIAEEYWKLHCQPRGKWQREMVFE
ncbi:MAG: SDR family NAD(P)-dependent oxidoreductase [Ferruginibacter sp.]|nr:SDR family NAD(P)-dependent oxidoreductase [Cytophagales bacterium]